MKIHRCIPIALAIVAVSLLPLASCTEKNQPPEIHFFDSNPAMGEAPVQGWLLWSISDPDGDSLTCEIDTNGDQFPEQVIENCTSEDTAPFLAEAQGKHQITLTISDGLNRVSQEIGVYANHCPLLPYVKWPERVPGFGEVTLTENNMEILFRDPGQVGPDTAFTFRDGDILVGTTQGGYARIVRGVLPSLSTAGRRYHIMTEQAYLPDLVENCYFGARDLRMPMTQVTCEENCDQVASITQHTPEETDVKGGGSVSVTYEFNPKNLPDGGTIKSSLQFTLDIENIELDYTLVDGVKSFTLELKPSITAEVALSLPLVSGLSFDETYPLGSFTLTPITIGALIIVPKLQVGLKVKAAYEPKLTVTGEATASVLAGISYRKDEDPVLWHDTSFSASITEPLAEVGVGSAKIALVPKVSFLVYGIAGPFVEAEAFIAAELDGDLNTMQMCVEASVGTAAKYGVEFSFLGLNFSLEGELGSSSHQFYANCFDALCPDGNCGGEPICNDWVLEGDETCDPSMTCPTQCPDDGDPCTVESLEGDAAECTAQCVSIPVEQCLDGDLCCPTGCDGSSDTDCAASTCDSGILEGAETCEPRATCPWSCPVSDACQPRHLVGMPLECTSRCVDDPPITACQNSDGCCPSGCHVSNDDDCLAVCSNGVCESPTETTANCPEDCPLADPCQAVAGGSYCGMSSQFPGGVLDTLYTCSGGTTVDTESCSVGCYVAPPGQADYCEEPVLGEYGDTCGASGDCGASAPVCGAQGYCCIGAGGVEPEGACGTGADCCSGHCSGSLCCWNPDPPGCIL